LTECVPEICEDGDNDDYYKETPECRTGPFDCDDTNPDIHPFATEICDDVGKEDENCDDKKNCEDENCRLVLGEECNEQCDQDEDGYYSTSCGGGDCMDIPALNANAENVYPGNDQENTNELCHNEVSDDCDYEPDCADSDCAAFCQPTPTPTPTPGGGDGEPTETPDPCQGDECCGRGTHTECTGGWCDPAVEVCWTDPYTWQQTCIYYPPDCEPEYCTEVCN